MSVRRHELWLIALLVMMAFGVRVFDLTGRSIWLDEGTTLLRLNNSLVEQLSNVVYVAGERTIDTQPPLYFLLLKAFLVPAGEHEFIFRFFSVGFGVLCVPMAFALARRMFDWQTAFLAALFVTLSPGLVWYSREIRMYSLVPFLSAVMTYVAFADASSRESLIRGWAAWLVTATLSLLTHYTFAGLILGQGIFLLGATVQRWHALADRQRRMLAVLAGLLGAAVVLALWMPAVREVLQRMLTGSDINYAGVPLPIIIQTQFGGLLLGLNAFDPSDGAIGFIVAALCLFAVLAPSSPSEGSNSRMARVLLAASALTPLMSWYVLSFIKPNYQGFRHLILISPAAMVLLARGCVWLLRGIPTRWRHIRATALGILLCFAIVGVQLYGIVFTFMRTPNWQDDWRSLAYHVRDHWREGDLLVIGGMPVVALPIVPYLRGVDWVQEGGANAPQVLAPTVRRIWYVDRGRGWPKWLDGRGFLRDTVILPARSTVVGVRLLEVDPPVTAALPADAALANGEVIAPGPQIHAFHFSRGSLLSPQPNFWLELYWRRDSKDEFEPLEDVDVSVRLLYDEQVWLDARVRAGLESAGAADWHAGSYFRTDHRIPLQPGLPELPYTLEITVLAGDKQEPVQRIAQPLPKDWLACCVRIQEWPGRIQPMTIAAAASPQPIVDARPLRVDWLSSIRLGDVVVRSVEYPGRSRPGDVMPVVITWQPDSDNSPAWQTELVVQGLFGGEVSSTRDGAGPADLPPMAWRSGELVRDQYSLRLPYDVRPGWYRLSLTRWRDGRAADGALLGLIRVEDYPRTPVAAQVQHPVDARVGELSLLGYSVDGPITRGRTHSFITHWRVEQAPARDGVLFLHMLTSNNVLVSQDDNPPIVDGKVRNMLTYRAGDGIDQEHRLFLPQDLPAGEYRLYAGIYDREGGLRWPAQQDGRPARDDLILLGTIILD